MNQKQHKQNSGEYDQPISKPLDEFLHRFVMSTEARFVTKRLPKLRDTHLNRRPHRHSEAR